MLEYKGYLGDVTFDSDAHIFHGEVLNTKDIITFQGITVDELETSFQESIKRLSSMVFRRWSRTIFWKI